MTNPKKKLFKTIFDNENDVLFSKQKDLVELLCNIDKSKSADVPFETRKKRMQIFLSNCINGKRRLSKDLKFNLEKVLDDRLKDNILARKIKKEIFNSFDFHYKSETVNKTAKKGTYSDISNKSSVHQNVFKGFIMRSEDADSILSVTSIPGENSKTKTGNKIIEFISESIGIYGKKKKLKQFTYLFPNYDNNKVAIEFWKTFYSHNQSLGIEDLDEKISKVNTDKLITVYSTSNDIVNFPVTCFNYNDYYKEYAYSSNLIDDLLVVMPLNPKVFRWWKGNIEDVLSSNEKNEVTFKDAKLIFENKSPLVSDSMLLSTQF
jgi:hypothetical protein